MSYSHDLLAMIDVPIQKARAKAKSGQSSATFVGNVLSFDYTGSVDVASGSILSVTVHNAVEGVEVQE